MNAPPPTDARPDNWIWLDIECTGLDEHAPDAAILEIGLVAVDAQLRELAHWSTPIKFGAGDLADVLRRAGLTDMHSNNGLLGELTGARSLIKFEAGGLPDLREAEAVALQFVAQFAPATFAPRRDGNGSYMVAGSPVCGANPGFDQRWIAEHMPTLASQFHYRGFDSNFCFMSEQRFGGGPSVKSEVRHRALDDCRQSIATVRRFFGLPAVAR